MAVACQQKPDSAPAREKANPSAGQLVALAPIATAYFDQALTYRYKVNATGRKGELWFYVNEKTKQILYVPDHELVKAIISYPDGRYVTFSIDGKGRKVRLEQRIGAVTASETKESGLVPLAENRIISQKTSNRKILFAKRMK